MHGRAMNRILDSSLVGLALLASAGYVLATLGPKGPRSRFYATLARLVARAPEALRLKSLARRLEARANSASGGCGGCGSCSSEPALTDSAPASASAPEIRVSVENIGKRH
jgi:hypothetical protein